MPPLRVGIVGCGGIAQMMHLPTLAERADLFQIVALADVSEKTLDAVGDRYGVKARFKDGRELAGQKDVEAVLLFASGCHRDAVLDLPRRAQAAVRGEAAGLQPARDGRGRARGARGGRAVHDGLPQAVRPRLPARARGPCRRCATCATSRSPSFIPTTAPTGRTTSSCPRPTAHGRSRPEPEQIADTHERVMRGALKGCVDRIVGDKAPAHHRVGAALLFESLIHDIDAVRGVLGDPEGVVSAHVWRDGLAQTSISRFAGDVRASLSWISVPGLKHYEETLRFVGPDTAGHAGLSLALHPPRAHAAHDRADGRRRAGGRESHRVLRRGVPRRAALTSTRR